MGIAGLGTYSSTSFYYAMSNRSKNSNVGNESAFGLTPKTDGEQTDVATTSNKTAVSSAQAAYSRCITANIKSEELVARQSADGEMIYSYQASEQSFKIWINSDGSNKTYSIEGIDKDGQPFTKEFDPYDVDPEDADFPEFAALCMYIQNTNETADMLANEYFATDDILEKCDYLDKMQGFSLDGFFEKTQAMMDNLDKGPDVSEWSDYAQKGAKSIEDSQITILMPESLKQKMEADSDFASEIMKKVSDWKKNYDSADTAIGMSLGESYSQVKMDLQTGSYLIELDARRRGKADEVKKYIGGYEGAYSR